MQCAVKALPRIARQCYKHDDLAALSMCTDAFTRDLAV